MDTSAITSGLFLDPVAIGIVGGGTLLSALLRHSLRDIAQAMVALGTIARARFTADALVEQIAAQGRIARRHGAVALDRSLIRDPDVAAAVAAIVDGEDATAVTAILDARRRGRAERHLAAIEVWSGMAEAAPAMGMVGTLVGLVAMFARMTDPAAIGGAMAVALLATLYGALVSNLIANPIASRLRAAARAEAVERERLVAPLAALAAREAPRVLRAAPEPAERQAA